MDLYKLVEPITSAKNFDTITGVVALANPLALLPALWAIYTSESAEGQSIWMWIIFLLIQITFALVGAKARNNGAFASMAISAVMSSVAIVMLLTK